MNPRLAVASFFFAISFAVTSAGQTAGANTQPSAPAASQTSALLQPVLSDVQSSTSSLNISRWKAPGSVKDAAQQNVDSIQRDLGSTLPGLIAQADAAPGSVTPSFAVYRNIDALYDVLLRVSETADIAGSDTEGNSIASSLQRLEAARSQLAERILNLSQRNEAQMLALEAAAKQIKTTPVEPKREIVVDDGPAKEPANRAKKKTTPKKPAPKPAANPSQ